MTKKSTLHTIVLAGLVALMAGCSSNSVETKAEYPKSQEDARRERLGRLTGEGLVVFGGKGGSEDAAKTNVGIGINSYLWRATLETLAFMPLGAADPFGGVVITDWYEDPEIPGEKFKVNVLILDRKLHANALKVKVFKQNFAEGGWRDSAPNPQLATDLENKILTRARALRVEKEGGAGS